MKNLFTKWLAALLIATLLLTPMAMMETDEPIADESAEITEDVSEDDFEEIVTENVDAVGDEIIVDIDDIAEDADPVEDADADLEFDPEAFTSPSFEAMYDAGSTVESPSYITVNEKNYPTVSLQEAINAYKNAYGSAITALYISKVDDLTGLDSLTALEKLSVNDSSVSALDLSKLASLKDLSLMHNSVISAIDVSKNPALESIYINDCSALSSLSLGNASKLTYLGVLKTKITSLDISGCTLITPYVNDEHKTVNTDGTVTYSQYNPETEGAWNYPWLDIAASVKLVITAASTPTPAPESTPEPTATPAPVTPTIAATKKSSKTTISAAPGTVYQLDLGGATGKKFKSSKKKVATVSSTGLVTVKKAGKTKITFKVGKKKRTVTLKIVDPTIPKSVTLNMAGTNAVKKGDTVTLTATLPEGTVSGIKWKSSNKKVATVSNGVVTFKKKGKVTITATATRGKKKARVKFKVSK